MICLMRRCTVCVHPDRATIDAELLQGISYPTVAGRYGLSTTAVFRHRRWHVDAPTVGDIVVPVGRGDFWREWDGTKWQRIAAPRREHLKTVKGRPSAPWNTGFDPYYRFAFSRPVVRRRQLR